MLTVGISMQLQWGPLMRDQHHREFMILFISSSVDNTEFVKYFCKESEPRTHYFLHKRQR